MTFDETIYSDLIEAGYGIDRASIMKVNIKGKMQLWTGPTTTEPDMEIPLKQRHPFRRAGCTHCPDFTAEHAGISLGGIGKYPDTTLAIIRSILAADLIRDMEVAVLISVREGEATRSGCLELITKLAQKQRRRWPQSDGKTP